MVTVVTNGQTPVYEGAIDLAERPRFEFFGQLQPEKVNVKAKNFEGESVARMRVSALIGGKWHFFVFDTTWATVYEFDELRKNSRGKYELVYRSLVYIEVPNESQLSPYYWLKRKGEVDENKDFENPGT